MTSFAAEEKIVVNSESQERDYASEYKEILGANTEPDSAVEALKNAVKSAVSYFFDCTAAIIGFVVLSSVTGALFENGSSLQKCVSFSCSAAMCLYIVGKRYIDIDSGKLLIDSLAGVSESLLPIECSMLISSLKPASAIFQGHSLRIVISACELIFSKIAFPILTCAFALSVSSPVFPASSGICEFMKKISVTVSVTAMSITSFFLTLRQSLATSADGIALRSARFAVGSFVPMVGGALSETIGYVSGGIGYIKNTCGIMAVCAMFALLIPTLLKSAFVALSLSFSSMVASLCDEGTSAVLKSLSSCSVCLFVTELASCSIFIIRIAIFVKAGCA